LKRIGEDAIGKGDAGASVIVTVGVSVGVSVIVGASVDVSVGETVSVSVGTTSGGGCVDPGGNWQAKMERINPKAVKASARDDFICTSRNPVKPKIKKPLKTPINLRSLQVNKIELAKMKIIALTQSLSQSRLQSQLFNPEC